MDERPFTQESIHRVRSEGMDKPNVAQCKEAKIQSDDESRHIIIIHQVHKSDNTKPPLATANRSR